MDDHVALGQQLQAVGVQAEPVAGHVAGHGGHPRSHLGLEPVAELLTEQVEAVFFRISLVARCRGVARRPGRISRTRRLSGTLRSRRSTRAVPRNPVAPVMKNCRPARAPRTRVTRSVYHMVSE